MARPQGTLTVNGYTPERTSAPTKSVRLEVKRESDEEWIEVETVDTSVAAVEADLADIREGIADAASKDVADPRVVEPYEAYRKWSVLVDTTTLEDTITKDTADAARDVSEDANSYMVRAISLTPDDVDKPEHGSPEGVTASFSVDNVDDVGPLGPTYLSVKMLILQKMAATPLVDSSISMTRRSVHLWLPLPLSQKRIERPTSQSGS